MSLCSWESSNSPAGPSALAPPSRGKLFNRDLPGLGGGGGGSFFPVLLEEASSDFPDEEADSGRSKGALGALGMKPLPLGEPSPALTAGGAELPLLLAPPTGLLAPLGGSLLWLRYLEMSDWSLSPLSEPAFSGSVQIIVNIEDFSHFFSLFLYIFFNEDIVELMFVYNDEQIISYEYVCKLNNGEKKDMVRIWGADWKLC